MKVLFLIIISLCVIFLSCTEEAEIPENNISKKMTFQLGKAKDFFYTIVHLVMEKMEMDSENFLGTDWNLSHQILQPKNL